MAITLPEKPDLKSVPKTVRDKVSWDGKINTLTISTPLTEDEAEVLKASVTSETAAAAIVEAAEVSRTTAIEFFQTPAELGERFRVPQLALRVQGELALFDDPEVLEYPWDLSLYDAAPTANDLTALGAALKVSEGGEIDIDAGGRVFSRFLPELQRDLGLVYQPENWDELRIATWLCRNLPEPSLTHASKQAFVAAWITDLLCREGFTLARANLQKFLIRNLIEARIRELRKQAVGKAFQQALFGDDAATRVAVTDQYMFEFHAQAYAPAATTTGASGVSISASTSMGAWVTSTARKSTNAPVSWTCGLNKVASSSGYAISCGAKAVRFSCRRPMAASIQTSSASCPVWRDSLKPFWWSNTRVLTAGQVPRQIGSSVVCGPTCRKGVAAS